MRALAVELSAPAIEAALLRLCSPCRRHGGLLLERAVDALVAAILLRLAGVDALVTNAERDPPGRELGEPARPGRGEGGTIVAADRLWQPVFAKGRLEDLADLGRARIEHYLGAEPNATERIGEG